MKSGPKVLKVPKIPKINLTKLSSATTKSSSQGVSSNSNIPRLSSSGNLHSQGYLSYTFRAKKEKITKSKKEQDNYLFDLKNTLTLNIQMINSLLPTIKLKDESQTKSLTKSFTFIQSLISRRKKLIQNKENLKTKILIDKQVLEQEERRIEENKKCNNVHLDDMYANVNKKRIYIRKFQKKFDEVEIYIQRECQNRAKWKKKFSEYEIMPFVNANGQLLLNKQNLISQVDNLHCQYKKIFKDNSALKKHFSEFNFYSNQNSTIDYNKNNKIYCLNYTYKQYCNIVQSYKLKIRLLQNDKNKLSEIYEYMKIQMNLMNKGKEENSKNNRNSLYTNITSNNTYNKGDIDNKINLYKNNFSIEKFMKINNLNDNEHNNESKKSRNVASNNDSNFLAVTGTIPDYDMSLENTKYKETLKDTLIAWDISRIEKNEDQG